jgi:hypothetical protein
MTSRANPSARFRELEGIYARVHTGGLSQSDNPEPASVFAGNSLLPFVDDIRELIVSTRSRPSSIMDAARASSINCTS